MDMFVDFPLDRLNRQIQNAKCSHLLFRQLGLTAAIHTKSKFVLRIRLTYPANLRCIEHSTRTNIRNVLLE